MLQIFKKLVGTQHDRQMKLVRPIVARINSLEDQYKALSETDLKAMTGQLKQRVANGESLDSVLPDAFAVCREASRRHLGMRHYDVQLIGGYILHKGSIAEMRTGEGKTRRHIARVSQCSERKRRARRNGERLPRSS